MMLKCWNVTGRALLEDLRSAEGTLLTEDCKTLYKALSIQVSFEVHSKRTPLLVYCFPLRRELPTKSNPLKVYPVTCVVMGTNPFPLVKP